MTLTEEQRDRIGNAIRMTGGAYGYAAIDAAVAAAIEAVEQIPAEDVGEISDLELVTELKRIHRAPSLQDAAARMRVKWRIVRR